MIDTVAGFVIGSSVSTILFSMLFVIYTSSTNKKWKNICSMWQELAIAWEREYKKQVECSDHFEAACGEFKATAEAAASAAKKERDK